MAKVWVQVRQTVYYDNGGTQAVAHPGDWIEIGKHQARMLLAKGSVAIPEPSRLHAVQDYSDCGVVVRAEELPDTPGPDRLQFVLGDPSLPFAHTVIWEPSLAAQPTAIENGLVLLRGGEGWEMLAMVVDESTRAADVGSEDERRQTEAVVGDLRIPVYDTRLLWVRETPATSALVEAWAKELEGGADERHAFLRALYSARVMLYTLPQGWRGLRGRWRP